MNRLLTRVGLWTLPLAGVLVAVPWFVVNGRDGRGISDLTRDPDGFVQWLTSPMAAAAGYAYLLGLVSLLFGLLALYGLVVDSPAPAWAVLGPLVGIAATALLLPLFGVLMLADPVIADVYQAGHKDVIEALKPLAGGNLAPRLIGYVLVVSLLALLAAIASGVALWRSGRVPRWTGVVFALGFLLCSLSAPLVTPLGALLVLLSGAGMALSLRERAATRPALA